MRRVHHHNNRQRSQLTQHLLLDERVSRVPIVNCPAIIGTSRNSMSVSSLAQKIIISNIMVGENRKKGNE